jgi:hypothetical protein
MNIRVCLSCSLLFALCAVSAPVQAAAFQLRQSWSANALGEGAPARGFGTQVAVDGNLAVVSDLASTLGIRQAIVRTYVRTGGVWVRQTQELNTNTGSPSTKVKLALGDGTLIVMYQINSTSTQVRIYR